MVAVRKEIDEFNQDIDSKTPEEIREFEDKLKYIRAVCLLNEIGSVRRFFDMIRTTGRNDIHDLSSSIARYGELKDKFVTSREDWIDRIRVTLGKSPKNPINRTRTDSLDRTGTDPLMR